MQFQKQPVKRPIDFPAGTKEFLRPEDPPHRELHLVRLPDVKSLKAPAPLSSFTAGVLPYPASSPSAAQRKKRFFQEAFTPESWTARQIKLGVIRASARHLRLHKRCWLYHCDVPVANLSPAFENFRILHLSDLHFKAGSTRAIAEVEHIAQHLKQTGAPDLVILSGDVITDGPLDLDGFSLNVLKKVARHAACAFVLGNHDYYGGAKGRVESRLSRIGYRNITNLRLKLSRGEDTLNIYGVDDALEGNPRIPVLSESEHKECNILVTHNLDLLHAGFSDAFDLVLSGHTHAGENFFGTLLGGLPLRLLNLTKIRNGHFRDWHALTDRALSYVSPGLGRRTPHFGTNKPGAALLTLKRAAL